VRDSAKFDRVLTFGKALPLIRRQVSRDLTRRGLPKEKVLATVVRLMEQTLIRVGNEEYARSNRSYGLTTMRDHHARVRGRSVTFDFLGKSNKRHRISLNDPRLAKVVKNCQDLPGQKLFQYIDEDGQRRDITSTDVNAYLGQIASCDFTAKDFRTWAGTVLMAFALQKYAEFDSQAEAKRQIREAVETVAHELGNTAAVCRSSYIHPLIIESHLAGSSPLKTKGRAMSRHRRSFTGLNSGEAAVLSFLRKSSKVH
jgi:DNA topoisomerase-1